MATENETISSTKNADGGGVQQVGGEPKTEPKTEPEKETAPVKATREVPARAIPMGPFALMRQLFDDLAQMWGGATTPRSRQAVAFIPDIEVARRGDKLVVKADLPGMTRDDVEVNVLDDALVITGERRSEHEQQDEGMWSCERSYGSFRREIGLPEGTDASSAEAKFENGVLEISLSITDQSKARGRKIEIQGEPMHH